MRLHRLDATVFLRVCKFTEIDVFFRHLKLTLRAGKSHLQFLLQIDDLRLSLFQLCKSYLHFLINPGNFTVFLVKYILKLVFEFLFLIFEICPETLKCFIFLLFEIFNSLVKYFNVKFELLFNFDMVSNFGLVLLKLLLVLFWR